MYVYDKHDNPLINATINIYRGWLSPEWRTSFATCYRRAAENRTLSGADRFVCDLFKGTNRGCVRSWKRNESDIEATAIIATTRNYLVIVIIFYLRIRWKTRWVISSHKVDTCRGWYRSCFMLCASWATKSIAQKWRVLIAVGVWRDIFPRNRRCEFSPEKSRRETFQRQGRSRTTRRFNLHVPRNWGSPLREFNVLPSLSCEGRLITKT